MRRFFILTPLALAVLIIGISMNAAKAGDANYRHYKKDITFTSTIPLDSPGTPGVGLKHVDTMKLNGSINIGMAKMEGFNVVNFSAIAPSINGVTGDDSLGIANDTLYLLLSTMDGSGFYKAVASKLCTSYPCTLRYVTSLDTLMYSDVIFRSIYRDSTHDTVSSARNVTFPIHTETYLK